MNPDLNPAESGIIEALWAIRRLLEDPRLSAAYAVSRVRETLAMIRADLHCEACTAMRDRSWVALLDFTERATRADVIAVREDLRERIGVLQRAARDGVTVLVEEPAAFRARVRRETLEEVVELLESRVTGGGTTRTFRRYTTTQACVNAVAHLLVQVPAVRS